MGDFFGQVQLPDWTQINALFSPDAVMQRHNQALASSYLPQQADLQTQSAQQDLTDRASLRSYAPGLAAGTPAAFAGAAVLPGGANALNSLNSLNSNNVDSGIKLGQAWGALPQGMSPPQAPWLGQPSAGAGAGRVNQLLTPSGGMPANFEDNFINALGRSESPGGPSVVNQQGYNGQFQFGSPRLQDLHVYQPAQGEISATGKWNGQTNGSFTIPGFPQVKTQQDFLNNPDAQRAVMHAQVADLMTKAQNTPGAENFDPTGLLAVGHLGGAQGMVNFIKSGGAYNPHDANGTTLANYYQKFAGNPGALQAAAGHPLGPLPSDHPALQDPTYQVASATNTQGMPNTQTDASSQSVSSASPSSVQNLLNSYRQATPAQQDPSTQVSIDPAYAGPRSAIAAPGQAMSSQEAVAQAQRDLTGKIESMTPDAQNNAIIARAQQLMGGGAPPQAAAQPQAVPVPAPQQAPHQGAPPVPPQSEQMMPATAQSTPMQATAAPSQQGQAWQPQVPDGYQLKLNNYHMPMPSGTPGYGIAENAQGQRVLVRITPPELKFEKTPKEIIGTDPNTGQVVSRVPITETGRQTLVPTADGNQVWINGHPTGQTIPYGGRPEQNEAYKADQNTAASLVTSAQNAQNSMPQLNAMADLAPQLASGAFGDSRAKAQSYLEALGVDPSAASKLTGMSSAAAAQEFTKLAIATAGSAAKADLGANNGVQGMELYRAANPNLSLAPDANIKITNMIRVARQAQQDYAQSALQHFGTNESTFLKGGQYAPLTAFNREWQAQANPQIYSAATGILNGDPYGSWASKLSNPADAVRAAAIAARIDPRAMVPIAGGKTVPARNLIGAQ